MIDLDDLKNYYDSWNGKREIKWRDKLGQDLNWALSFDNLREKDTTKHVHRLHPYKGKFIPQLVEYFLDEHVDEFKKEVFFKPGDIVLDPFLGSGTTIVQAIEMGIHSIGIDISEFNCMIATCKVENYELNHIKKSIEMILKSLDSFENINSITLFENELLTALAKFNSKYFPGHEYRYSISHGEINENEIAKLSEKDFLPIFNDLVNKHSVKLKQSNNFSFLDTWYIDNVRREIEHVFSKIKEESDVKTRKLLALILSRTIRSCRATTHSDLATLKEPQITTYYCYKHKKICKPIFSIRNTLKRYSIDTFNRIKEFSNIRQQVYWSVLPGDSRNINIFNQIEKKNPEFFRLLHNNKISGIFCSPPYVGQIDYHEQHAYAYELLGFKRCDELEIGSLSNGQNLDARESYVNGIVDVLLNCRQFLRDDFNIFIVANDKYNLYPKITEKANLRIYNQYKRPVLNRTERDRNPYSEIIFHIKGK